MPTNNLQWSFRRIPAREVKQNPQHLEYFRSEALRETTDALVREDIQNRLDARDGTKAPAEVRYTLIDDGIKFGDRWFNGLDQNLASPEVSDLLNREAPRPNTPVPCLIIEDFNTHGLRGDPSIHRDPEKGKEPRDDFYWFIRNVGRSGKAEGDRGRWGLGKIVYPASSHIRSFFSLSITADESPTTLIGRSVLCIHSPDNIEDLASDGFFSCYDEVSKMDLPSYDSEDIKEFKTHFHLTRDSEPGLSLIIPFPKEDITCEDLTLSLIDHWFWALLDESLTVRLTDTEGAQTVLSKDTLDDVIKRYVPADDQEAYLRKTQFVREIIDLKKSDGYSPIRIVSGENMPSWPQAEALIGGDESLEELRALYNDGELLSFHFELPVNRYGDDENKRGNFDLYLRRSDENHRAMDTTLREGLAISGLSSVNVPGVSLIVYVGNNPVGTVLGDSENPAHTHWRSMNMNKKYPEGAKIVKFVSAAPQKILALLTRVDEGLDHSLLENIFSIPDLNDKPKPSPTKKGKRKDPPPMPDPKQKNYYLSCNRYKNGFKVTPHEKANQPLEGFIVRAAYEVSRGNAFDKHNKADFDLSDPETSELDYIGEGIESVTSSANKMTILIKDSDFSFAITGFDPHRDLILDIKPIKSESTDPAPELEPSETKA